MGGDAGVAPPGIRQFGLGPSNGIALDILGISRRGRWVR
jgi:hypothetical protein